MKIGIQRGAYSMALAACVLALPLLASAATVRAGQNVSIPASEAIQDDLYAAGNNVSADGIVRGDISALGGTVLVNGSTTNDVNVAGGTLTILGSVGDDVRAAGGTVVINAQVGGDLVAFGGQVRAGGRGVAGDAVLAGGSVRLEAPVGKNVRINGSDVYIDGTIRGNVEVRAKTLTLGSDAVIEGTLAYTSPKEMQKDPAAKVLGEITYSREPVIEIPEKAALAGLLSAWIFVRLIALLIAAFLVGLVFRSYIAEASMRIMTNPLREGVRGLVSIIVVPVISVLLCFTLIGLPFALFGMLGFILLMMLGNVVAPVILGVLVYRAITKDEGYDSTWKTILIGVAIYFVLGLVPFIGWLLKALILALAIGAMVKIKMDILQEWR